MGEAEPPGLASDESAPTAGRRLRAWWNGLPLMRRAATVAGAVLAIAVVVALLGWAVPGPLLLGAALAFFLVNTRGETGAQRAKWALLGTCVALASLAAMAESQSSAVLRPRVLLDAYTGVGVLAFVALVVVHFSKHAPAWVFGMIAFGLLGLVAVTGILSILFEPVIVPQEQPLARWLYFVVALVFGWLVVLGADGLYSAASDYGAKTPKDWAPDSSTALVLVTATITAAVSLFGVWHGWILAPVDKVPLLDASTAVEHEGTSEDLSRVALSFSITNPTDESIEVLASPYRLGWATDAQFRYAQNLQKCVNDALRSDSELTQEAADRLCRGIHRFVPTRDALEEGQQSGEFWPSIVRLSPSSDAEAHIVAFVPSSAAFVRLRRVLVFGFADRVAHGFSPATRPDDGDESCMAMTDDDRIDLHMVAIEPITGMINAAERPLLEVGWVDDETGLVGLICERHDGEVKLAEDSSDYGIVIEATFDDYPMPVVSTGQVGRSANAEPTLSETEAAE